MQLIPGASQKRYKRIPRKLKKELKKKFGVNRLSDTALYSYKTMQVLNTLINKLAKYEVVVTENIRLMLGDIDPRSDIPGASIDLERDLFGY